MKKILKILFYSLSGFILLLLVAFFVFDFSRIGPGISREIADIGLWAGGCYITGGSLESLPNGCGDQCNDGEPMLCTLLEVTACDCGPDACWNGTKCVSGESDFDRSNN